MTKYEFARRQFRQRSEVIKNEIERLLEIPADNGYNAINIDRLRWEGKVICGVLLRVHASQRNVPLSPLHNSASSNIV